MSDGRLRGVWPSLFTLALGCSPTDGSSVEYEARRSGILGGEPARACEWPTAAELEPSRCSAVLVHRRAVLTAKHCLFDETGRLVAATAARFGEDAAAPARQVAVDVCHLEPSGSSDLAICTLQADAPAVPLIPPLSGCERDALVPAMPAVEVGFGDASGQGQLGRKQWLEVTLVQTRSDQASIEVSSGSQAGEYFGDSGGPLFVAVADGTWRVAGVDLGSDPLRADSGAPRFSVYADVSRFLPWAERRTGLDLTPCHTDGKWSPSDGCGSLPVAPSNGAGLWSSDCQQTATRPPEPTCLADVEELDAAEGHPLGGGGCQIALAPAASLSAIGGWLMLGCWTQRRAALLRRARRARRREPASGNAHAAHR